MVMDVFITLIIAILLFILTLFIAIIVEKKSFNKGICKYCKSKLINYDSDSQGGRGYKCKMCGYETWISWNCVDKDFNKNKNIYPFRLLNEDSTFIDDYPKNPLKEKWDEKYPPTRNGKPCKNVLGYQGDGTPIMNYTCVYCTEEKCQYSKSWKIPEEDKEEWNKYLEELNEYNKIHNPSLYFENSER